MVTEGRSFYAEGSDRGHERDLQLEPRHRRAFGPSAVSHRGVTRPPRFSTVSRGVAERVVQGYLNYYAVPGNLKRLGMFRAEVCRAWLSALRRRTQRTRMTWERFARLVTRYIPKVRARHPHPNERFAS